MLRREVTVRFPAAAYLLVALLLLAFVGTASALTKRRGCQGFGESKVDLTRMAVKDYTDSAFGMWRRNNHDRECPSTLGELNEYTNRRPKDGRPDISDVWGNDLRMSCGARGLRVWSLGEDGHYGTSDDIKSWE